MNDLKKYMEFLQEKGVSLKSEGISDFMLSPENSLHAIEILKNSGVPIIGGEVWRKNGDRFDITLDIWDLEKSEYSSRYCFFEESIKLAKNQAQKYIDKNDEFFLVINI